MRIKRTIFPSVKPCQDTAQRLKMSGRFEAERSRCVQAPGRAAASCHLFIISDMKKICRTNWVFQEDEWGRKATWRLFTWVYLCEERAGLQRGSDWAVRWNHTGGCCHVGVSSLGPADPHPTTSADALECLHDDHGSSPTAWLFPLRSEDLQTYCGNQFHNFIFIVLKLKAADF